MKLHRDLRGYAEDGKGHAESGIREACNVESDGLFAGPVEVDETYLAWS